MPRVRILIAGLAALACQPVLAAPPQHRFTAPFLGRWGEGRAGCDEGAVHGGITIRPTSITDGEFTGRVVTVAARPHQTLLVSELWDDAEGPPNRLTSFYVLSSDSRHLNARIVEDDGRAVFRKATRFIRCDRPHG